ncbi:cystathionine gamma-synthase/cystathionine beta-lyase [Acetitomaculum ruminis DSM 5522]|uniref:Cystathionine gamma-synthase/cystathionine beta-lyase n=1 Tax=Acetitomaculum ruminis DSM 5522 TaxID=1120918 RepID=A0A1I0YHC5_9FIRM|nr:PLP-dependent transferase [Acetitomaculum ruminis]SFB12611.1 cystathionine gamma-synthase/cystathionine beta-lyase [Acetitomaculum ruminis DSM 5522]
MRKEEQSEGTYEATLTTGNNAMAPDILGLPIYRTSVFKRMIPDRKRSNVQSSGNLSAKALAKKMASYDYGVTALTFLNAYKAMAATFSLFNSGDIVVIPTTMSSWNYKMLMDIFAIYRLNHISIDISNMIEVRKVLACKAYKGKVAAFFIETPSLPLMKVADIEEIAKVAHLSKSKVIVDNTLMTPHMQKPLLNGADIVMYFSGLNIVDAGNVEGSIVVVEDPDVGIKLKTVKKISDGDMGEVEAFVILQGLKSMKSRIDTRCKNAAGICGKLMKNELIKKVYYPGDQSSKGYWIQLKQARGFGEVFTFELDAKVNPEKFIENLKIINTDENNLSAGYYLTAVAKEEYEGRLLGLYCGTGNVDDVLTDIELALLGAI